MIPWIIMAFAALALVAIAMTARRRRAAATAIPPEEEAELEREFAAADAYEEQWREQDKERYHEERFP